MDKQQILALYDQDQRYAVEYPGMQRQVLPGVVRHTAINGAEGVVIYSSLDEQRVEQAIQEQVRYFEGIGQDFEWKVYDYDTPEDLRSRLATRGFEIEHADSIMVLDMSAIPNQLTRPVTLPVQKITASEIGQLVTMEQEVWGEDFGELEHYLTDTLTHHPESMSVYVSSMADRIVSAGWIYYPDGSRFASLWGGSTLAAYRRQGLYTALLATRIQEAIRRGVDYLTVDASSMSRPILEKHGFEKIAEACACKWRVKHGSHTR